MGEFGAVSMFIGFCKSKMSTKTSFSTIKFPSDPLLEVSTGSLKLFASIYIRPIVLDIKL